MPDSSSKGPSSSADDTVAAREAAGHAERERLIDDLAFLIVRQHRIDQRLPKAIHRSSTAVARPDS